MPGEPHHEDMKNQLYNEAADWFARMRGPDADASRVAFDAWLRRGALHRAAYNRVAEIFAMGKGLKEARHTPARKAPLRRRWLGAAAAAGFVALAITGYSFLGGRQAEKDPRHALAEVGAPHALPTLPGQIATPLGRIATYRLPDGSRVTLDTDSLVTFAMDGKERRLRLVRGRARFDVAHDGRAFRVSAAGGTVTALGTMFDVRLLDGNAVAVRLIRGRIAVALDRGAGKRTHDAVRRLTPGDSLVFTDRFAQRAPTPLNAAQNWPNGILDVEGASVSEILAEANRYGATQLVAGSARVAAMKVTGRFAIDEPLGLARRLAAVLKLRVDASEPGRLVLLEM